MCIGDLNADPYRGRFWKLIEEFSADCELRIADCCLPASTFSYLSPCHNSTTWLDHVMCRKNGFHHVCAHTWLCPHTLCPDTFVPRHVCAQTRLFPDMFVPTHVVPRHVTSNRFTKMFPGFTYYFYWSNSIRMKRYWRIWDILYSICNFFIPNLLQNLCPDTFEHKRV